MKNTIGFFGSSLYLIFILMVLAVSCGKDDEKDENSFVDTRDGKVYKTVKIGDQVWMAENLAYKPSSGNYWAYDNNNANVKTYGYLYDWYTALHVCPAGWHLPTDEEWTELSDFLGGREVAGGKLKATGTKHWSSPNTGATNETGFSALPGGARSHFYSSFESIGTSGCWWSATESLAVYAWYWKVHYYHGNAESGNVYKVDGFSVRCVED